MNVKTYKFYKGIFELAKKDYYNSPAAIKAFFDSALDFDFDIAAEMWDYLIMDAVTTKAPKAAAANVLGDNVLEIMLKKNANKTYKCIVEKETVTAALYTMPEKPGAGACNALIYFAMGNKFAEAEVLFKAMQKGDSYGAAMKDFIEKLFAEIKKKTGSAKVTMNKKTAEFLLGNIAKIRTSEKALLEQRIKEII